MSLGLLYTTFAQSQDPIMVPNTLVLGAAIVPLREPAAVDLRARLRPDVRPSDVQSLLDETIETPSAASRTISLEEVDCRRGRGRASRPSRSRTTTGRLGRRGAGGGRRRHAGTRRRAVDGAD